MKKGEKGRRKKKCLAKEIVVNVSACEKRENCFPLTLARHTQKKSIDYVHSRQAREVV